MNKNGGISLRKNFSWMFISNLIFALSQWGILISISHLGNVEMMGQYTLGLAIISPIIMFTNLDMSTVYITDQIKRYNFSDYFSSRIITVLFSMIILIILLCIVDFNSTTIIIVLLVSLYKILESVSNILYAPMQKQEYVNYVAISKIIKGTLSLMLVSLLLYITSSLVMGMIGVVFVYLFTLLLFDLKNSLRFDSIKIKFIYSHFYNIIKISLPLGIVQLLVSLNTNIPRYFVQYYFDTELLGYFSAISYMVVNNINVFTTALRSFIMPRFARLIYYKKLNDAKKLLKNFEILGLILGLISISTVFLFGEFLLTIIYGSEYADYTNVFKILILSTIFTFISSFYNFFIISAKYFKIQPFLGVIWVMSSIILGILLIPLFGIVGAAYAVVIVSIIQLLSRFILLQKIFRDMR